VLGGRSAWREWSLDQLARAREHARLAINVVVLAELHGGGRPGQDVTGWLRRLEIAIVPLAEDAAVRAGRAHGDYRRAGGPRRSILADFLIAGHAAALGATLLTRDRKRLASYFPELVVIAPEEPIP